MFRILPHDDDETPATETLADAYARMVGSRAAITGDEVATLVREYMSPADDILIVASFGSPFHVEPEQVIIMLEDSDKLIPIMLEACSDPLDDRKKYSRIYLGSNQ
jgi:hypothetical protein